MGCDSGAIREAGTGQRHGASALERAIPAAWVDDVFETHQQRQYPRELLFSPVVELMALVSLGLRPSLHAAGGRLAACRT